MPPRTIVANPAGPSNTLSFALPPGVSIDVESVLAAIDATAAGPTTALLEIADSSGAVIARKRQSEAVSGGSTGSATWALRLADEAPPAAPSDLVLLWEYTIVAPFQTAAVDTLTNGPMAGLLSQAFASLEIYTLTHIDTISAVRANVVMKFPATSGNPFSVITQELAGNPPATTSTYVATNGVTYCTAGQVNGVRGGAMTAWLPGYSSLVLHKAGNLLASTFVDDVAHPPEGIMQTTAFGWHPAAVRGVDRIRFETQAGMSVVDFAAGSYFAVYGRR